MLPLLADDANAAVRAAVAAHECCPVDTLVTLAHDPDAAVCKAAAENPSCPVDLLDQLLAVVPEVVLANSSAPEHLLVAGSQVRAPQLRAAVAANPSTPVRQLQLLGRDPDPLVAGALASNPNTPASVRRRARDGGANARGRSSEANPTRPTAAPAADGPHRGTRRVQATGQVAWTVDVQNATSSVPSSASEGSSPVDGPPASSARSAASTASVSDCSVYAIEMGRRALAVAP
jgi:hypothetical protein